MRVFAPALELDHVSKTFGTFRAVDDLSFSVAPGCVYGFLGPNGAGKTTTLRMVLDIFRPTSGRLLVLGADSAFKVRQRIGYLPEEKGLYKKMKAWAVIAYLASLKGLDRGTAERRARELLQRFGLAAVAETKIEALSKGMAQKVQVLAAIAHEPDLVIFDEPFSGLDPVNQAVLEEVIANLKARGVTLVFSTHVMQHAERLCDRLLIISRGKRLFEGTLKEAQRTQPVRVQLRAEENLDFLRQLPGATHLQKLDGGRWELRLTPDADPQSVLEACFSQRVRLQSYNAAEPTLHDVFVNLVGPDAREARADA